VKPVVTNPSPPKPVMGRPRLVIANRPEECPRGHRGNVILWGTREWTTAPFRRQRFQCVPSDGTGKHTFSLGRRRAAEHHPAGEECVTCDIRPGVAEGPISPSDYFHTAVEIAHLLQLVGQGMSLRRASLTVRLEGHRFWEDAHGMRHASRQNALAARYLDLFGTAIDARLAPTRCPKILVLDSKPLNLRAYGAEKSDPSWNRDERGGAVFVAIGGDDPDHRYMPWRVGLAPDETTRSWLDFLDEIDPEGPGPEWVVADGATAIENAVMRRWPNATFYSCEFHMGRALREAAGKDGIWTADPNRASLFERAFWTNHDWDALGVFAAAKGAANLAGWWKSNEQLVRQQVALHRAHKGFPRSNGAAERILDWIDQRFGRRRRYSLRNARRLQLVLALVRAYHAGQADLSTLAAIVKRELRTLGPDARFAWTALHDASTSVCSVAELIIDAHNRATQGTATYMAAAKARSVIANVAAQNDELAAIGHPPIVASVAPGRKTASVKVKGKMLGQVFPLVARDWDAKANTRLLPSITAGSSYKAHWKCHRCAYEWVAPVNQRTCRQTRCARCSTERADGRNSLAAVHPDLVAEWDAEANAPRRAGQIKATYDKAVTWRCRDDATHPAYKMSPFARAKKPTGCPICRKKRERRPSTVEIAA
jgi:hypothetical protein